MYDFPEKTKLNQLINQRLVAISCTANQIFFEFSNQIKLEVTGHLEHSNSSGQAQEINVPIDNLSIFGLIECEVSNVTIMNNKKEMAISFKNGEVLKFISDEMYESVYIHIDGESIIV
jgi:hypothetical protein